MRFQVKITKYAEKQLRKLDPQTFLLITNWMKKNLQDCENPCAHGKPLTANRTGQWRYRVGDYRIIAEIQHEEVIILILEVGHRKEIYNN